MAGSEHNVGYEPDDAYVEAFIERHPSGATYDEIAEALGVSKQRIPQILASAIDKLQQALRRRYGIRRIDDVLG